VRVFEAVARNLYDRGIRHCFETIRRQERKSAARLQKRARNQLRIQQVTLIIRSTLHTTIIHNSQPQPADRRGIIQNTSSPDCRRRGAQRRRRPRPPPRGARTVMDQVGPKDRRWRRT
jgi:hypothetical protein